MYVVVGGIGLVGGELARRLIENRHDVVVIDKDKDVCDRIYAETGVVAIHGNVSQVETLKEANIQKADVVAATTGSDADNLACAILAKSFGKGVSEYKQIAMELGKTNVLSFPLPKLPPESYKTSQSGTK